ncbi:MAG: Phage P1-like protein [Candidatus Moranbacteria bacterium GW2011_GWF1_34_10]|nr:MAG: Phage P1-like protein [Candidatus Moranbacteria bacterium GW2011_GWF1_34_10]
MPKLILLEDHDGNWEIYFEKVFGIFKKDFMAGNLKCNGINVIYIHNPEYKGKPFSFWHLISEGKIEDQRLPEIRRCERIGWPKAIIENSNDNSVKAWVVKRHNRKGKNQNRLCLCFGEWEYLVVLTVRKNLYVLCTAYPITFERRKYQLRKEYEEFRKKQTPPREAVSDAPSTAW